VRVEQPLKHLPVPVAQPVPAAPSVQAVFAGVALPVVAVM